ncbi:MAG: amidohydrolase [Gemmatimonadaceae bacterium]|nr:amidohydrolase [Gemmatimonadaceae bacterium]
MARTLRTVMLVPAIAAAVLIHGAGVARAQQTPEPDVRLERLKAEAGTRVDSLRGLTQQMVDMVFSFGELGFQEHETSRYLTGILEQNGFRVQRGVSGIPTAWTATWGSGRPVIAMGSDIDGIPQASQKPGVAYRDPLVEGAPGHGEGHNSGVPLNITAAIALKRIMEREKIPGTLMLWPGVAEELLGTKAYFARDGMFRDADAAIFTHVDSRLGTSWGSVAQNAVISAEFFFEGVTAHSAAAPWRGRSALDAVELMNAGWNYRREHLRLQHRSHYVIRDGGDQPNVVPRTASVWYFIRETDAARTSELFDVAQQIARGAALMTNTTFSRVRILGSAWDPHFNRPIAEAMQANIARVGVPTWTDADQSLARSLQREIGATTATGLATTIDSIIPTVPDNRKTGGGSDDIGDVSWTLPTVTLRFPSNIPGLPGHHWSNAVAMATPIAHKGATAGAKVVAMTVLDLLLAPSLLAEAKRYFTGVQTKDVKYVPLVGPDDRPAIEMNEALMARYRPAMRRFYYNPARYKTYLEQLGVKYPTVKPDTTN